MNDRREKDEAKLLAGAFHDDWANGPAADFARTAAAHARRRRILRRAVVGLGTASVVAAAVLLSLHPRRAGMTPPTPEIAATPKPAYETISDAELIAQLRDRPLLVVQKADGTKEITLVTEPPKEPATGGEEDSPHVE